MVFSFADKWKGQNLYQPFTMFQVDEFLRELMSTSTAKYSCLVQSLVPTLASNCRPRQKVTAFLEDVYEKVKKCNHKLEQQLAHWTKKKKPREKQKRRWNISLAPIMTSLHGVNVTRTHKDTHTHTHARARAHMHVCMFMMLREGLLWGHHINARVLALNNTIRA